MKNMNFDITGMLADCFAICENCAVKIISVYMPKSYYDFLKDKGHIETSDDTLWNAKLMKWSKENAVAIVGEEGFFGLFLIKDTEVDYKLGFVDNNEIKERVDSFKLNLFENKFEGKSELISVIDEFIFRLNEIKVKLG